ncbi:unnamed protein product [Laminaria digitata]
MKFIVALFVAFVAMASAFVPSTSCRGVITASRTHGEKHIGTGGMADTRDPEPKDDPDPRKSISAAPSFEEYLKQKQAEGK